MSGNNVNSIGPFRRGHRLKASEVETMRQALLRDSGNLPKHEGPHLRWAFTNSAIPGRDSGTDELGSGSVTLAKIEGFPSATIKPVALVSSGAVVTVYNAALEEVAANALVIIGRVENTWVVVWEECPDEGGGGGGGGGPLPPINQVYNDAWGVWVAEDNYMIPRDSVIVFVAKRDLIITTPDPSLQNVISPRFRLRGIDYVNSCILVSQGGKIERPDLHGNYVNTGIQQTVTLPVEYIFDSANSRWLLWDATMPTQPMIPVVPKRTAKQIGAIPLK